MCPGPADTGRDVGGGRDGRPGRATDRPGAAAGVPIRVRWRDRPAGGRDLRRRARRLERDGRSTPGDRAPPDQRRRGRLGAAVRARAGSRGRRPQRRPQPPGSFHLRRRGDHRPRGDAGRDGRPGASRRALQRRGPPRRARRRGAGLRPRVQQRHGLAHRRRGPDARRRHGPPAAQARAVHRLPARGRARHGRRPAGPRERRREPGPVLGHARRGRELRDRDGTRVRPGADRPDDHPRLPDLPGQARTRGRRGLSRLPADGTRRPDGFRGGDHGDPRRGLSARGRGRAHRRPGGRLRRAGGGCRPGPGAARPRSAPG